MLPCSPVRAKPFPPPCPERLKNFWRFAKRSAASELSLFSALICLSAAFLSACLIPIQKFVRPSPPGRWHRYDYYYCILFTDLCHRFHLPRLAKPNSESELADNLALNKTSNGSVSRESDLKIEFPRRSKFSIVRVEFVFFVSRYQQARDDTRHRIFHSRHSKIPFEASFLCFSNDFTPILCQNSHVTWMRERFKEDFFLIIFLRVVITLLTSW